MSRVTRVPETAHSATDGRPGAWETLRRFGIGRLLREAFVRFRYGDGFSHSRALGLQLALSAVPLLIATIGLSRTLGQRRVGEVIRETVLDIVPDGGGALRRTLARPEAATGPVDEVALWLGLVFALVSLATAMGQIERGANRLYGVERDRPSIKKYGRAALMNLGVALPAMVGVVILVSTSAFSDAAERVYAVDDDLVAAVGIPVGATLILVAAAVVFRKAPRRTQPGASWLAVGAVVSLGAWALVTAAFAGYLQFSSTFTTVYGPLTAMMAVLLWTELSAMSFLYGLSCAAQLEAARAGLLAGAPEDPEDPEG